MRGLLVLLGMVAAVLIAGVVALPRLVDEAALRAQLLTAASAAIGRPVESGSAARLELTPLPRLSIDRVRLRGSGPFRLEADRIDIDLALPALVRGRLEPSRLELVRPTIEIERLPADLPAALVMALGRDPGSIRDLQVIDGTITFAAGAGAAAMPRKLEAVDLVLSHDPELRRLSASGTAQLADEPLRIDLTLDPVPLAGPAALEMNVAAGAGDAAVAVAFHGGLEGAAGPLAGRLRLAAPGGRLPAWLARLLGTEGMAALPGGFELTGDLQLEPGRMRLDELEMALAGTRARGRATAAWDGAPRVETTLEAAEAAVTPELEAVLRWLAGAAADARGMSGRLELRLANLVWRAGEIRRVRAVLDLAPGRRIGIPRLDAVLPGETDLRWIGGESDGETVRGALSLQASELRAFLQWLGAPAAELPAGGLTSLDLSAQAALSPAGATLTTLEGRLDATLLAGSLAFRPGDRPRLELALAADRLNTALYLGDHPGPMLDVWRQHLIDLDATLDITVDRLSHDVWRDGELSLRATAEAGRVVLERLRLAGEGGARLLARGTADLAAPAYELEGELATGRSDQLALMLGVAPGPALGGLLPASLRGRLQGDAEAAGLEASLRAGIVSGSLRGSLGGPFDPRFLDLAGELALSDPAAVLAAFGWPSASAAGLGGVGATFGLTRDRGPLSIAATGRVGGDEIRAKLKLDLAQPSAATLALAARTLDTAKLGLAYGALASPLGFPAGWPWEWPGVWPRQPLTWQWLDGPALAIDLSAAALQHEGAVLPAASAAARRSGGRLTLTDLDLPLAGGRLAGTLTLEREADHGLLSGDLRLRGARAEQVAGLLAPGSGLAGTLDAGARLLARGRSIADFARSLEGEGEFALRDGELAGVTFPPVAATTAPIEPALQMLLLQGPLRATRGVVASDADGLELTYGAGLAGRAALRLDVSTWLLEFILKDGEPEPITLRLIGAPGRLRQAPPLLDHD